MPDASRTLMGLIHALRIHPGRGFDWFGEPVLRIPARIARKLPPDAAGAVLRTSIARHLYEHFYLLGAATPLRRAPYVVDAGLEGHAFRRAITRASRLDQTTPAEWNVLEQGEVMTVLERYGLRAQLVNVPAPDTEGGTLILDEPTGLARLSPGHMLFRCGGGVRGERIVRLYWNVLPRGACALTSAITRELAVAGRPFTFKILNSPGAYERRDSAVLYLDENDVATMQRPIGRVHRRVAGALRSGVPAFTEPVAEGLGAAEDPGGGRSFGVVICDLLADALVTAAASGHTAPTARMATLRGAMVDADLDPDRLHLRPASSGAWMANLRLGPSPQRRAGRHRADAAALAARIGAGIAKRAIWHGEQCTWVGAANEATHSARERRVTALGPTLYDGTAGLAVLFAELAAAGSGDAARETALGALRHAASRDRADTGPVSLSAYTGPIGTVWAAACVAVLLKSDEAMTIARAHLRHLVRGEFDHRETDVLNGVAGAALALHAIAELGVPGGADLLARCMDRLKVAARRGPDGAHWQGIDAPTHRPGLTGYSHGAAGIAATLGLLGKRNADAEALHLAREGVRYEQGHFSEAAGNWADLRERRPRSGVVFSHYWCHGAPGIGLGRASMAATLDCQELRAQAYTALDTTAAFVAATAFKPDEPHCLCHGLPGNALTLSRSLEGSPVSPRPKWEEALAAARDGMAAAYDGRDGAFGRCAGDSGTPGLMLGEGGLAYWFLSASGPMRTGLLDLSIRPTGV